MIYDTVKCQAAVICAIACRIALSKVEPGCRRQGGGTMTVPKFVYQKNEKGEFVCPDCGITKARQNTMFYHMKKHAGDKSYVCTVCSKGFIQKSGLVQHMLQAHAEPGSAPAHACPCCDHTAKMKANLLIHIGRKHSDGWIPPVDSAGACTCAGCNREFSSATAYYYHAVQCFTAPTEMQEKLALLSA